MDRNDARPYLNFLRRPGEENAPAKKTVPLASGPAIDADEFDMSHSRRGRAIILNHSTFKNGNSDRAGSDKDVASLEATFHKLQFSVEVHHNKTKKYIFDLLESVAGDADADVDCLAVVVMTHGDTDELSAYDAEYSVTKLWKTFTADNCKALAGKPKLFFIQACRGDATDSGTTMIACSKSKTQTDASPRITYTIPNVSDILIANATFDGHFAWRSGVAGSWFIQALCQELHLSGETREVCQILTRVNRRVAISYASSVPNNPKLHQKKQMPNFLSTLTRELYFRPKPAHGPSAMRR